ncbi:hypothetical protein Nepgr_013863 [Nepenthes gracilis]|uniref:lipid-A-disaccharide synthase n=1 Tax=Nepenthes gracilis TaxID=150966 RepID=A0AAD3SJ46_NEPGR|nr:hypothetical protein Nepgr_013863 [Nepenthes gracilis]
MLPIFSRTMELLKGSLPQITTIIHVAPNQHVENYINRMVQQWPVPVILVPGGSTQLKYDSFSASRAALCTSGTVTMELQLARLPCLVAYRAHILTEWFIRYNAKVPYMSLSNILLNSPAIPEALMSACTPTRLASSLMEIIHNEDHRTQQIISAEKVMKLLYPSRNEGLHSNSNPMKSEVFYYTIDKVVSLDIKDVLPIEITCIYSVAREFEAGLLQMLFAAHGHLTVLFGFVSSNDKGSEIREI